MNLFKFINLKSIYYLLFYKPENQFCGEGVINKVCIVKELNYIDANGRLLAWLFLNHKRAFKRVCVLPNSTLLFIPYFKRRWVLDKFYRKILLLNPLHISIACNYLDIKYEDFIIHIREINLK